MSQWHLIEELVQKSRRLFLKKLSRNDTSWADVGGGHQSGFYVPRDIREADFFPELASRADKPHILEAVCPSFWPQTAEVREESRIQFFSNKRSECHFTRIPKELFLGLSPASWLIGGALNEPIGRAHHWFIVIDSESQDAELIESRLDIQSDFHFALFLPGQFISINKIEEDIQAQLAAEINDALRNGSLNMLRAKYSKLPSAEMLAEQARITFLRMGGLNLLDPWNIENPGDALMRISRDIEYTIYRRYELLHRAIEVASVIHEYKDAASASVRGFSALNAIFLSASQQRKSRGGKSFENHLAELLRAGGIRYEAQAVLGQRRPDFVLPDQRTLALGDQRTYSEAAILSAKTTLRERWKQITHERFNCAIFLATVDDRISSETLRELRAADITLVVPESMKMRNNESFYWEDSNVISFRTFFDYELATKRPSLLISGKPQPFADPQSLF
ncbi:TPA: hypothetical protein QDZ10_002991 [Stenotrophomonas maltophilia]|nr:hypothetical protein [Stenotrophomonas maltophilia]